ncbi:M14 family metallopeptidase [Bordetella bronchialis]|uniref:Peptidase M14 n=2 Tax=Bordetella bronchialis TaxID=463025 RepID=A0A193FVW0_9BORD|nr:M14 family metallopeptidase [Bordetella bronchialis]ANN66083.1 peptidase M14 [Bordetella bronchialis]ANN71169.1 peptidase M14 [Bordetella bronchialis]
MGIIKDFLAGHEGGARRHGAIAVGSMASGMAVELPYVAVRGARPGKTLWLHGQVHGDEINGMVAALRFAARLDPQAMRGNVVVTPTGNPHALDSRRKRNPYDDLDLDQCYPGSARGLISERLAHALIGEIRGTADLVINLHTMNALFDSRPYAVYKLHPDSGVAENDLLRAIALFEPHVACRMDVGGKGELPGNIAGALDYQCLAARIPAFMLELGGGSRFEAANVALAERGFERLAVRMGILEGASEAPASVRRVTRRGWITFDHGGLFVPEVQAGDAVDEGGLLGVAMDIHGNERERIRLPAAGIIIGLRRDPVVHTGERAAFVAYEWDRYTL